MKITDLPNKPNSKHNNLYIVVDAHMDSLCVVGNTLHSVIRPAVKKIIMIHQPNSHWWWQNIVLSLSHSLFLSYSLSLSPPPHIFPSPCFVRFDPSVYQHIIYVMVEWDSHPDQCSHGYLISLASAGLMEMELREPQMWIWRINGRVRERHRQHTSLYIKLLCAILQSLCVTHMQVLKGKLPASLTITSPFHP